MGSIDQLKQLTIADTPVFLFQFAVPSGPTEYWSTHPVAMGGQSYSARVLRHNAFQLRASMDPSADGQVGLTVVLANADGICAEVEQEYGWKGTRVTVQFAFFDLASGAATSEARVIFCGIANPVQEITDSQCRVTFTDRMNLQRVYVPQVRIQRQCPWVFPSTAAERQEAVNGGTAGVYSRFYPCGYSADIAGGCGNLNNGAAFTSCDGTRSSCIARGMFQADSSNQATRRFGGLEFVPPAILVRSYGERSYHASAVSANQALYNDFVPLTYGTGWYNPPVVFARNDGNLTRMEVLLGLGEISAVLKVIVNGTEIPAGQSGVNMTATGWYNVLNSGNRTGTFDPDYTDGQGNPIGDPYGSLAYLSIAVPNALSQGTSLPVIDILLQGLQIQQYDAAGNQAAFGYTNSPAWVLLDLLLRNGWSASELDTGSFAAAAAACAVTVETVDANGTPATVPTASCNLLLTDRRSLGDVVRGVRNAGALYFVLASSGLLQLRSEGPLAVQQPAQPAGGNSAEALDGGWPVYEFGDNSLSGILRASSGSSSLSVYSRSLADSPNFVSVEFQDELNEYQQDSLSMFDADDAACCGQEINVALPAVGISNFAQAGRLTALYLNKSLEGNTYVEFSTSFRAISINPGDLIAITYARQNWSRQPFRVLTVAPDLNYRTAVVTAQVHDDEWYTGAGLASGGRRQAAFNTGIPRPLIGTVVTPSGQTEFGITEAETEQSDGNELFALSVSFVTPRQPGASSAGIPLLSLIATSSVTGGTLAGGTTWYYGVSATDASGNESPLSFLAVGTTAPGTNTNTITIEALSFTATTASFSVYRGTTGLDLLRIATGIAPTQSFTDTGLSAAAIPPPDMNYDHANFYWRYEMTPQTNAQTSSATTIGSSGLQMTAGEYAGYLVRITGGTGAGQESTIVSNNASTLTVSPAWSIPPDSTSTFVVVEPGWRFGAKAISGPVTIDVPPTVYFVVEICGVAANVYNDECPMSLSPITPYQLGGGTADTGVPGVPTYGIATSGDGTVTIAGIGFTSLTNTASITAGTFTLQYWDEFNNPTSFSLACDITADAGDAGLSGPTIPNGTLVQVDSELVLVTGTSANNYTVTRGAYGTQPAAHTANTPAYPLEADVAVLPFVPHLFGTPASGEYSYTLSLPHTRIAASELFVTNAFGNSPACQTAVTNTTDEGLRTLTGGQITIQIQGNIAIQTAAAPPFVVDTERAIRDIYAVAGQAPSGGAVVLNVTVNGSALCQLTIADGAAISNVVNGFGLAPLQEQAQVNVDITSVPGGTNDVSARDLTVTIRL